MSLTEEAVGMAPVQAQIIECVFRERYSAFVVREVGPDGAVARVVAEAPPADAPDEAPVCCPNPSSNTSRIAEPVLALINCSLLRPPLRSMQISFIRSTIQMDQNLTNAVTERAALQNSFLTSSCRVKKSWFCRLERDE